LLLVINFASDKRLRLVDILVHQRGPDGNTIVHRQREAPARVICSVAPYTWH